MNSINYYKHYLKKKINFSKNLKLKLLSCDVCKKKDYKLLTFKSLLNSSENKYIYFPTSICNFCGHAQQIFRLSKNFYKEYYSVFLSKNTNIRKYDKSRIKNSIKRGEVLIKFLERKLKIKFKNQKILDVGCGYGGMLQAFHNRGCKVIGIDPDLRTLNVGKKIFKNLDLRIIESEKLNLKKNSYDLIIINGSLEHVYDPNIVMKKVSSYLKNNGFLFLEGKGYPLDIKENFFNFSHQRIFTKISFSNLCGKLKIFKLSSSYTSPLNKLKIEFASKGHKNFAKIKINNKANLYWLGYKDTKKKNIKIKKDVFFENFFKKQKRSNHGSK